MTRTVVVTGSAQGIGAACVDVFRRSGYRVIGVDRTESSAADEHHSIELSSPASGERLITALGPQPVHGLVNNAGMQLNAAAEDSTAEMFDQVMSVNLRAPLLLAAALKPRLSEVSGFVVNVASVHAVATSRQISIYAASKGGLVAMTRAMAVEWAPAVRVNAVLPGAIETGMLIEGLARNDLDLDSLGERHPVGRVGTPAEVADAVLFLAQNEFATGTSLTVDGGATARLSTE